MRVMRRCALVEGRPRREPRHAITPVHPGGPPGRGRDQLTRVEIGGDRSAAPMCIRQAHVAVRPHEIDGIAPQAGAIHLWTPRKDVQGQFPFNTRRLRLAGGRHRTRGPATSTAISGVKLSSIVRLRRHPRQTIAAVHDLPRARRSSCCRGSGSPSARSCGT